MRKLVHLVFAIWKTGRPFDPHHYPWQTPAHVPASDNALSPTASTSDNALSAEQQAAGLMPDRSPARSEVTAACTGSAAAGDAYIDFAHLKSQLPLARVLDQLAWPPRCAAVVRSGVARVPSIAATVAAARSAST
jgi:hypothetical protein